MLYIEEIWVKGCFLIYEEVKHPVITPLNLHLSHGRFYWDHSVQPRVKANMFSVHLQKFVCIPN